MADEDLRDAFEKLKREDARIAAGFELPDADADADADDVLPRWQWRTGVIAACSTGAAAVVAALVFALNFSAPDVGGEPVAESTVVPDKVAAIPFDDYSERISRQLFAASAGDWQSPSDFLLDFDTTLTELE